MFKETATLLFLFTILQTAIVTKCSDITNNVFTSSLTSSLPAAFGDFNSDELTDVFVIRNNGRTMEIFLAHEEEPLLRSPAPALQCNFTKSQKVTSVVPGDFDGDAFMDVLVTVKSENDAKYSDVYIMWGGATYLNCSDKPVLRMIGQPLAIDYNQDMIVDLFGTDQDNKRTFWIFSKTRDHYTVSMKGSEHSPSLINPHSHAFLGKLCAY